MATVLITGAGRGWDWNFASNMRLKAGKSWPVGRNPETAGKLADIPQVRVFPLDVSDFAQIDNLAAQLQDTAIDVLINNAGI